MTKQTSESNGSIAGAPPITPEEREQKISTAAYYRALQRGFAEGDPVEDWLQAEQEIDTGPLSLPLLQSESAQGDSSSHQKTARRTNARSF